MLQTNCFICFEPLPSSSSHSGGSGRVGSAKCLLKSLLSLVGISYTSFINGLIENQDVEFVSDTCVRCCHLIEVGEDLKKNLRIVRQQLVDRVAAGYPKRRVSPQNAHVSSTAAEAAHLLARSLGECFSRSAVIIRSEDEIPPEKLAFLKPEAIAQTNAEEIELVFEDGDDKFLDDFEPEETVGSDADEAQASPPPKRKRGRPRKTPACPKVVKKPKQKLDLNQPIHSDTFPAPETSLPSHSETIPTSETSIVLHAGTVPASAPVVLPTAIGQWVLHPQAGLLLAIQYNTVVPTAPLLCTGDGNGVPHEIRPQPQEPTVKDLEPPTDKIPRWAEEPFVEVVEPPIDEIPPRTEEPMVEVLEPPTDNEALDNSPNEGSEDEVLLENSGSSSSESESKLVIAQMKRRNKNKKDYELKVKKRNQRGGRFRCGKCPLTWAAMLRLIKHVRAEHDMLSPFDRPYGCATCPATFHTIESLKNHLIHYTIAKDQKEDCLLCEFSDDLPVLVGHYFKEHGLDYLKCKYFGCARCLLAFQPTGEIARSGLVREEDLPNFKLFAENHSSCLQPEELNVPQRCRICPETRLTAAELISHEVTHSPALYCTFCDIEFKTERELETHNSVFHKKYRKYAPRTVKPRLPKPIQKVPNIRKFRCNVCHKRFRLEKKLTAHIATHAVDQNTEIDTSNLYNQAEYKCLICESFFSGFMDLYQHTKGIHNLRLFNQLDDVFCSCFSCLTLFESSDPTQLPGRLLIKDHENLKQFATEHAICSKQPVSEFNCPRCQYGYTEPKLLFKHMLGCRRNKGQYVNKYLCPQCPSEFESNVEYLHHLRQQHVERLKVTCQCQRCGKQFKDMQTLQDHAFENSKKLKCPACDQNFKGLQAYEKHQCILNQLPAPEEIRLTEAPPCSTKLNGGFSCLSCDKTFGSVALLSVHFQEHHDKSQEVSFNCSICSTVLTSSETLQNNDDKSFYSTQNGLKHPDFVSLCTQHWKTCILNPNPTPCCELPEPSFECYVCHQTKDSPQTLAVHLNEHHGATEVHRCQACTLIFKRKRLLVSHMFLFHNVNSIDAERYFCRNCWLPFHPTNPEMKLGGVDEKEDMLKFHTFLDSHFQCKTEKVMPVKCRHCPLEFRAVRTLLAHDITMHSKSHLKHCCDKCGKGFQNFCNFNYHMQSHEIEDGKREKFKCPKCEKAFFTQNYLNQHVRSHDKEPPLICQHCGKGFSLRSSLSTHVRNHSVVMPTKPEVPCTICGKLFLTMKYMKYHIALTHEKRPMRKIRKKVASKGRKHKTD